MNFVIFNLITLSLSQLIIATNSDWEDEFDYNTYLDDANQYRLYWTNLGNNSIELGIEANATGWIALGISPNGQMPNSDIMFGWITDDDGTIYLQDRYTIGRSPPLYDVQQNLTLISGEQVDGMTRIRFTRPVVSCDSQDLSFEEGTTRMLYAFNKDTDPTQEFFDSSSVEWHGNNKGSQSLNIDTGIPDTVKLENDTEWFDAVMQDVHVPAQDTTYWCKLIKLPEFNETHHIVKIAPVVDNRSEPIIHHLVTYHCVTNIAETAINDPDGPCDSWTSNASQCLSGGINYAWAVGGNDLYYPKEAGMPLSGDSSLQYVVLQIHYNNPEQKSGYIDSSGIRIWHTPTLRQYDAGLISIGTMVSPLGQFIPPGIDYTKNSGFCTSDCTQAGISGSDVTDGTVYAFASLLHAHTIAVALNLQQIRDGVELENVDRNWAYDFNYQQTIIFDQVKEIKAGDEFIMNCYLNSTTRDWITTGGESTSEEMCLAFIYVYPAPKLAECWTEFTIDSMQNWLEDAQDAGYIEGNISNAVNYWEYDQLSWNDQGDKQGAKKMYNQLWDTTNDDYNQHWQLCITDNGTWLTPFDGDLDNLIRLQPTNFTKYEDNSYDCNATMDMTISPSIEPTLEPTIEPTVELNTDSNKKLNVGAIFGILLGAIVVLLVIIFVIMKCYCGKQNGDWEQKQELVAHDYNKMNSV